MRILHCIYDDPQNPWVGGGGAVRLHEIYRRLAGRLDVTLVTGRFPGSRDESGESFRSVRLGAESPYAWSRLSYAVAATRMLRTAAYDAAVFDFSAYTPILIPRDRPVGVMLGQLTGSTARARFGRAAGSIVAKWERMQLGQARSVAAVSASLLEEAQPFLATGATACVVGAGVDEQFFAVQRAEQDYLLYYGRLDVFQKGLDVLLDGIATVLREQPWIGLKIAGRGKDAGRVAAMIGERGLDARVELILNPNPQRTQQLLGGALALLMPSRFEGFGMVAAEALAGGVPVIATDVGAVADVVGDAGILIGREDPAALAAAVSALLASPDRRAVLSAAGRRRASRWSWDRVAADHMAWLQQIAGIRAEGRRGVGA